MNTTEGKTQDNHKKVKTAAEQTQKKRKKILKKPKCFGIGEQRGAESKGGSWDCTRKKKCAHGFYSPGMIKVGNGVLGIGVTRVWSTICTQQRAEMHLVHLTG